MRYRSMVRTMSASFLSLGLIAAVGCGRGQEPAAPASNAPPASSESASAQVPPPAPESEPAPAPVTPAPAPAKPKPSPAPRPAQQTPVAEAPKPTPPPEPITKTLAVGTSLSTELVSGASSKTSKVGDAVRARVTEPVEIDGLTVVPAGSMISGTVTEAKPLNKIGGQAVLGIKFDTLELPDGHTVPVIASIAQKGKSETGKDAGTIAGATAGGALLGRLLSKHDKTKGTLIGAAVGAAAGTGAAAATKGQEVELPPGATLALTLENAAQVTVVR